MAELLFWNTLIESVEWLNERQGEQFTPKSLIQKILDKAQTTGTPFPPTIIKTALPRDTQLASLLLFPKEGDIGEFEIHMNERMTIAHGTPFIKGCIYTGYLSANAIPLYPAQIAELIIHGNIEISVIHENQLCGYKFRDSECGYILPVGAKHIATIETCGINRDDLLGLLEQLDKSKSLVPSASDVIQHGVIVNTPNRIVIKDLALEIAQQLADRNRIGWAESDGDDHIRRTIVTWLNENGWEPDAVPGLLNHILSMLEARKITARSTFNDLPPTTPSEITRHPDKFYLSLSDAEIFKRELLVDMLQNNQPMASDVNYGDAGNCDYKKANDTQSSTSKHSSNGNPSRDTDLTSEILKALSKALDPNSDTSVWTELRNMALSGEGLFTGLVDEKGLHYEKSYGNDAAIFSKNALSKRLKRIRSRGATESR